MPRSSSSRTAPLPSVDESVSALTVDDLRWRLAAVEPGRAAGRKADLVAALRQALTDGDEIRRLWAQLKPAQQQVIGEITHGDGRYHRSSMSAKYPGVLSPRHTEAEYVFGYGGGSKRVAATPFDLFFFRDNDHGTYLPPDLAAALRPLAPAPEPTRLPSRVEPPVELAKPATPWLDRPPIVTITDLEPATFHDLAATLQLIGEGKASVGATTRLPSLATVRQLRSRLLVGDYLAGDYSRADDAMRPLALILLVQVAGWASPEREGATRLTLTKAGQAVMTNSIQARDIRTAWQAWLKNDLLDELSRVKGIQGQRTRDTSLTKPASRRTGVATALRVLPPDRWVTLDDFFDYLLAERLSPTVERGYSNLYVAGHAEYGSLHTHGEAYWDFVIGSYCRVLLWEYAATLGLIDLTYTEPEAGQVDLRGVWGMEDEPYLSRYDGLLGLRVTGLGAYVFGLTTTYVASAPRAEAVQPMLRLLPTLDVVVIDKHRLTPNDRSFLERVGEERSQDVFHLGREPVLDLVDSGFSLAHVRQFLADRVGSAPDAWPATVQTFFDDLGGRLGALRDTGRQILITGRDPLLITELAHDATLRAVVQVATIAGETVLLVPETQETTVRRQLKKLGYLPARSGQ